jgi:hypothetical protein
MNTIVSIAIAPLVVYLLDRTRRKNTLMHEEIGYTLMNLVLGKHCHLFSSVTEARRKRNDVDECGCLAISSLFMGVLTYVSLRERRFV